MSRAKAFWLGLGCTLAVLLPIYLAVAAVIFTRSAPADTVQSGVPIAQPTLGDEKNFLLMTGPEQPETFVLLRFDALEGNLCSVAIPGETVVLVNGRPATLADAAEQAGPAQAAAALMETLDIEIDNYLYCTADRLVDLAAGFGVTVADCVIGDYTLKYQPVCYVRAVLESEAAPENLKQLVTALYLYYRMSQMS